MRSHHKKNGPIKLAEPLRRTSEKQLETGSVLSSRLIELLCQGAVFESMVAEQPDMVAGPLSSTLYFQGLQALSDKYTSDPSQGVHVMDSKPTTLGDVLNDVLISLVFFAMPQWQLEAGLTQILWAVEVHHYFENCEYFPEQHWALSSQNSEGFLTFPRQQFNDKCFFHDELAVVADIADVMATDQPESLVIRVFRTYAAPARFDYHCQIVDRPTKDNILILWIRESSSMGRFRPLNENVSLEEQVNDFDDERITK